MGTLLVNGAAVVTQIIIAWIASGDANEAAAIAAGRSVTLSTNQDMANFLQSVTNGVTPNASGYTINSAALVAGTTYTPSVQLTYSSYIGPWVRGTVFALPGSTTTTTTTTAAPATTAPPSTTTTTTTTTPAPGTTAAPGGAGSFTGSGAWTGGGVFTVTTTGSGSASIDGGGNLVISCNVATDTAYFTKFLTPGVAKNYQITFMAPSVNDGAAMIPKIFGTTGTMQGILNFSGSDFSNVEFTAFASDGTTALYGDGSGNWGAAGSISRLILTAGNYYTLKLISTSTGLSMVLYNCTVSGGVVTLGSIVRNFQEYAWSHFTGGISLQFGKVWTTAYTGQILFQQYIES